MASPITHASVILLALLYPENFSLLALLVGSLIPDIESPFNYIKSLLVNKKPIKAYLETELGFLHTLLGSLFTVPVSVFLTYLITGNFSVITIYSAIIGVVTHLLLDLPGHRRFILFYPYIKKDNPFRFKMKIGFLEKFYPWKKQESVKNQVMSEYNWWVVSHILFIISVIMYVLN
jgi:hypothetical protein